MGQLAIEGATSDPVAAYVLVARDPAPIGQRLWDLNWGDTVLWLPSPFTPVRSGDVLNLLPEPKKILPVPGRFLVTAVLVLAPEALAELDPRGPKAVPGDLNEPETARFLTNVRRLVVRKSPPIVVASNEYQVMLPHAA